MSNASKPFINPLNPFNVPTSPIPLPKPFRFTPPVGPIKPLFDPAKLKPVFTPPPVSPIKPVFTPQFDLAKLLAPAVVPPAPPLSTTNIPKFTMPPLPPNPVVTNMEANYASEFYNRLMTMIGQFEARLDDQHEIGMRLVSFGDSKVIRLNSMGWYNPSLISFAGLDQDGNSVELIQHVSQISLLLITLPKLDPNKPKRRIGFHAEPPDNTAELPYPPQPDHGGTAPAAPAN